MKTKLKKHLKDTILYLTSSSVLFASCSEGHIELNSQEFADDSDEQLNLLPIDVYLNLNEKNYLKFIEDFSIDVLQNKKIGAEFINNPKELLKKYNLEDVNFDPKSNEIQIIMALSDDKVLECLNNGDFFEFWKLIEEKGIFERERSSIYNSIMSKISISNSSLSEDQSIMIDNLQNDEIRVNFAVIVAVVVLIYVAVGTIAAVELGVYVHAAVHQYTASSGPSRPGEELTMRSSTTASKYYLDQLLDGDMLRLWKSNQNKEKLFEWGNNERDILLSILKEANKQHIISEANLSESIKTIDGFLSSVK